MLAKDTMIGGSNRSIVSMKLCMEWTNDARGPLALSEEVTRPSLKKAGHLIVHFAHQVKLHLDCIFVSVDFILSIVYRIAGFT
jgi:hypothetical protein